MTVEELIALLQKYDPKTTVYRWDSDYEEVSISQIDTFGHAEFGGPHILIK